ncbi:MAG TPA: hypothetical protein ENN09_03435 [Planctomycetes bacterium]|nr:hypothetical protein [Planctomycetota bacterium]
MRRGRRAIVTAALAAGFAVSAGYYLFSLGRGAHDTRIPVSRSSIVAQPQSTEQLTPERRGDFAPPPAAADATAPLQAAAAPDAPDAPISDLLSGKQSSEVVEATIVQYGRNRDESSLDEVLMLSGDARDVRVRSVAIRNLVLVGGRKHPEKTVPVLEKALFDVEPQVQAEALRVMGRFVEHLSPAARQRIKELSALTPRNREEERVREAARMLREHVETAAKLPGAIGEQMAAGYAHIEAE